MNYGKSGKPSMIGQNTKDMFVFLQYFCQFLPLNTGKTALTFNSGLISHSFPVVTKNIDKNTYNKFLIMERKLIKSIDLNSGLTLLQLYLSPNLLTLLTKIGHI